MSGFVAMTGRIWGERFRVGESTQAAGQIGCGVCEFEGTLFESDGDGGGHVQSLVVGILQDRGELPPVRVRDQVGIHLHGERLPAACVRRLR